MFFQVQLGYNELQSFNGEIGSEHAYKTTYILGCENSKVSNCHKNVHTKCHGKWKKTHPPRNITMTFCGNLGIYYRFYP